MVFKLEDKVALITGSSSGIGAATAILFSQLGAKVVIVGRNQEKLDKVAREVSAKSPKNYQPLVINADFAKDEDVKKVFDQTIETYSQLDILVNNAGMGNRTRFDDGGYLEDYDRVMQVNLRAPLQLSHLARPYLASAKGCIVNVSSTAGQKPVSLMWDYCISKAGLDMMTRVLAQTMAPEVRVNAVSPGPVKTDILGHIGDSQKLLQLLGSFLPLKRAGEPEEIAKLIAFLSSDASAFITGSIYVADGGSLVVGSTLPGMTKAD